MKPVRVGVSLVAVLAAALSACSSTGTKANTHASASPAPAAAVNDDQATISYSETEPENPLIPGNTTEVGGISVLGALFKGLVEYDAKTAAPRNAVAESISTSDSKVYKI